MGGTIATANRKSLDSQVAIIQKNKYVSNKSEMSI